MAFKTVDQYNEEKYGGKFVLHNDGDFADVIFLYRSTKDVLVADVHYVKSNEYSGYVHCNGGGCPACAKDIRVQNKLFIPVYNIQADEIQFWDRTTNFEPQLQGDVFSKYPNPSEFVFRITRQGAARDINTKYQIVAVGNNNVKSYNELLAQFNAKFPDYYENICKDVDAYTLANWVNNAGSGSNSAANSTGMVDYVPTPRVTVTPETSIESIPEIDSSDEEIDEPVDFN